MNIERITHIDHPDWPTIWRLYETSFPPGERRTLEGQRAVIGEPKYRFELIRADDETIIGLTAGWFYDQFRYLEHFAVEPWRRGGGFGSAILTEWMHRPGPVILLEIDPPEDDISRKRLAFYERFGFRMNAWDHSHPSYQDGTGQVPLRLLSYPDTVGEDLYREFIRVQCDEMIAHLKRP